MLAVAGCVVAVADLANVLRGLDRMHRSLMSFEGGWAGGWATVQHEHMICFLGQVCMWIRGETHSCWTHIHSYPAGVAD